MAKKKEEAPKFVVTPRMALEAIAKVAAWGPDELDIVNLSDDAIMKELRENYEVVGFDSNDAVRAVTDDGLKRDFDSIREMDHGQEIWDYLMGFRKAMSKEKVFGGAGGTKPEVVKTETGSNKQEVVTKPPVEPKATKYTRTKSIADAILSCTNGFTLAELNEKANKLYVEHGGADKPATSMSFTGPTVATMEDLGLIVTHHDKKLYYEPHHPNKGQDAA